MELRGGVGGGVFVWVHEEGGFAEGFAEEGGGKGGGRVDAEEAVEVVGGGGVVGFWGHGGDGWLVWWRLFGRWKWNVWVDSS